MVYQKCRKEVDSHSSCLRKPPSMRTILKVAKYTRHDRRNIKKGRNKSLAQRDNKVKTPVVKSSHLPVKIEKGMYIKE